MLTSLFGDLGTSKSSKAHRQSSEDDSDHGFAATTLMESVATEVNTRGQIIDRHSSDLVVSGSPAQAIRDHFANTRADLQSATPLITLLDPAGIWASAVIKALSDAGGQPIDRLHLREKSTLRTLATIERTMLVRRREETLRICHANVRAPGRDAAEIPVALMERSHLTTVIIGPQAPHAIDDLLEALLAAAQLPGWRCRHLLFMLPPNTLWVAQKIDAVAWPKHVHVHVQSESMTGASAVWNTMLNVWDHIKAQPDWHLTASQVLLTANHEFPIKLNQLGDAGQTAPEATHAPEPPTQPGALHVSAPIRPELHEPAHTRETLRALRTLDGLLACALVDTTSGLVLAHESNPDHSIDIELAAAGSSQIMRAHRQAARSMSMAPQIDEVMTTAGTRQQILRTLTHHPELFVMVLLDKQRANLAQTRYRLTEMERVMT